MTALILIIILSIYTVASTTYIVVIRKTYTKEINRLKNNCKTISNSLEDIASRMTSGNISHQKGNVLQVSEFLKHLNN